MRLETAYPFLPSQLRTDPTKRNQGGIILSARSLALRRNQAASHPAARGSHPRGLMLGIY
jgi:hypothetical protein